MRDILAPTRAIIAAAARIQPAPPRQIHILPPRRCYRIAQMSDAEIMQRMRERMRCDPSMLSRTRTHQRGLER